MIPFRSLDQVDVGDLIHSPRMWPGNPYIEVVEVDRVHDTWVLKTKDNPRIPWIRGSLDIYKGSGYIFIEKGEKPYDPTQAGDRDDDI